MVSPWNIRVGDSYLWSGEYRMVVTSINENGWVDFTAPNGSTHNMPLQEFADAVSKESRDHAGVSR